MTMSGSSRRDEQLQLAMIRDRHRLSRLRQRLHRPQATVEQRAQYDELLANSLALAENRRRGLPQLEFAQDLPILSHRDAIVRLIHQHQVVVICGETGSGKSTQLPKLCLQAGTGRCSA